MARSDEEAVRLRIMVTGAPADVRFRLQSGRRDLAPPVGTTGTTLSFDFEVRVGRRPQGQPNFLGPYAQGPPDARFVYINSGTLAGQADSPWSRRAKVPLGGITWALIERARARNVPVSTEVPAMGRDGGPTCATVRGVQWRA